MQKQIAVFVTALFLLQIVAVSALTSSDAKPDWLTKREASSDAHQAYREAITKMEGS